MDWKAKVGRVVPWAVAAVAGLFEALGVKVAWWGVAGGLIIGITQFILSMIPEK